MATAKEMMKWCINYPREMLALLDANVLPRQKADSKTGRPAYQFEPRAGGLGKIVHSRRGMWRVLFYWVLLYLFSLPLFPAQITMVTVGSLPGLAELPENRALLKRPPGALRFVVLP